MEQVSRNFPLRVPKSYISNIKKGNITDPKLLQILPSSYELEKYNNYSLDPVHDHSSFVTSNLLKKYHGRALLFISNNCHINCRFCFRRHLRTDTDLYLDKAFSAIEEDKTLSEIILSGGDPLFLPNNMLNSIIKQIEKFNHIKRLRVHTRLPVVIPEKITDSLISIFSKSRLKNYFVLHINHPSEVTKTFQKHINIINNHRIVLLSQSVLLRNINDNSKTLASLFEKLVNLEIIPYYLHQLDKVQGAAHFHVEINKGKKIIADLRKKLPGYAIPQYVQEVSGEPSKIPII